MSIIGKVLNKNESMIDLGQNQIFVFEFVKTTKNNVLKSLIDDEPIKRYVSSEFKHFGVGDYVFECREFPDGFYDYQDFGFRALESHLGLDSHFGGIDFTCSTFKVGNKSYLLGHDGDGSDEIVLLSDSPDNLTFIPAQLM